MSSVKAYEPIRLGVWYSFKNAKDKEEFIRIAVRTHKDTLQGAFDFDKGEPLDPTIDFYLSKAALRVTPHGHHLGYRTSVDSRYMSTTLFELKELTIMTTTNNKNNIAEKDMITDPLLLKYLGEDEAAIYEEHNKKVQEILAVDAVAKAYYSFVSTYHKHNRNAEPLPTLFDIVSRKCLDSKTQGMLDVLQEATEAKLKKVRDRAFECNMLLNRCDKGAGEYAGILSQYGFLRKDPEEESKKLREVKE